MNASDEKKALPRASLYSLTLRTRLAGSTRQPEAVASRAPLIVFCSRPATIVEPSRRLTTSPRDAAHAGKAWPVLCTAKASGSSA
ncbi:hypothetical protein D9M68_389400 [compost metagenome]